MDKLEARLRRKERIRKKVSGSAERPRLSVYRSLSNIFAQLIDDQAGRTILAASTLSKDFKGGSPKGASPKNKKDAGNLKGAKLLGTLVAKKAKAQGIERVVFDRGGFLFHGRIKAFADGAREGGLKF
ncbi:MAG: 50S ribosomal protein L18 [Deltaproteobacteria bacterium]|nr:50S ribosomal protein L18 [Deltaproteobacteria bacterium]